VEVIDDVLRAKFNRKTHCEWCGKYVPTGLECAHIFTKGMGGGQWLDIPCNLLALCPPFTGNNCHQKAHNGRIRKGDPRTGTVLVGAAVIRAELLAIVGRREGMTPEQIVATVHELRRRPKCSIVREV